MIDKPSQYMKEFQEERLEYKKRVLKYTRHSKRKEALIKDIKYLEKVLEKKE